MVRIEASRFMARQIPGATLVELEDDDHRWWLDDVDVLLGRLLVLREAGEGRAAAAVNRSGCKPQAEKARPLRTSRVWGTNRGQGQAGAASFLTNKDPSGGQDVQAS